MSKVFDPKKLGEEADELIRTQGQEPPEVETPPEGTTEVGTEDATTTEDVIAQAESTPAPDQGVQSDETPSDDVVDTSTALAGMQKQLDVAEQRWKVLQGMYAKKESELDTMRELLADMNKAAPPQEVTAQVAEITTPLITDNDVKEYGKDYVDFVTRASRQAFLTELNSSPLLGNLDARLKALEGTMQGVEQTSANTAQNVFFNELSQMVPDWRTLNNDASFLAWLDQTDQLAGTTKMELLQDAVSSGDAPRAAQFFGAYKAETTPDPKVAPAPTPKASSGKDKLVAPGKTKAATPVADEKHNWTRAEIAKLYDDKMAGKITAKEFDKLERDIFAAQAEGRIAA